MQDKRLLAAASLIRPGSPVCDVGTDHGYLPVYLIEAGITSRAVACDINEKPLAAAREHIAAHGLSSRIETVLSDGLANVPPEKARDVVIAGMGGELISRVVLSCPYSRDSSIRFILQPMTRAAFLRSSLYAAGFSIFREIPVVDGKHRYAVMQVSYEKEPETISPLFALVGKIPESRTPDTLPYLMGERNRILKIRNGLLRSKPSLKQEKQYDALMEGLDRIIEEVLKQCPG